MKASLSQAAGRVLREALATHEPAQKNEAIVPDVGYAAARASLIAAAVREREQRVWRGKVGRVLLVPAVAVALGLAVVGARSLWLGEPSEVSSGFRIGEERRGEVGALYVAQAEAPLPLRFEDGSDVELRPGARARVTELKSGKLVLALEEGSARFKVTPGRNTWEITAGPYAVHVTGTVFILAWSASSQELLLKMEQGAVVVSGPTLSEPRRVSGQEELRLRASSESPPPSVSSEPVASNDNTHEERGADDRRGVQLPREPGWAELLARGDYDLILQAAERRGIAEVLASGSLSDLRALADAARFRGEVSLSRRALTSLRARFPKTDAASTATFLLGRQADDANDWQTALRYYDEYLATGGKLSAEASGRRMLVLAKLGRREESRHAAEEYLKRFPNGPYAKKANTLAR